MTDWPLVVQREEVVELEEALENALRTVRDQNQNLEQKRRIAKEAIAAINLGTSVEQIRHYPALDRPAMTKLVEIDVSNPAEQKEYCPLCGRWLVTYYEDGNFDLAGKAAVIVDIQVSGETWQVEKSGGRFGSAICYRWRCRWGRWRESTRKN